MISQFALRLLCGISLTWLMLPRSQITPGFFRIQSLLALALGALAGIAVGQSVFAPVGETSLLPVSVARGGAWSLGDLRISVRFCGHSGAARREQSASSRSR